MGQIVGGNAGAAILNGDLDARAIRDRLGADPHPTSGSGIFGGVVEEILHAIDDQVFVDRNQRQAGTDETLDFHPGFTQSRGTDADRAADDSLGGGRRKIGTVVRRLSAREGEDLLDRPFR
jgi:hypothetical protein